MKPKMSKVQKNTLARREATAKLKAKITPAQRKQAEQTVKDYIDGMLSPHTRIAYNSDIKSFMRYIDRKGEPLLDTLVEVDRSQAAYYREHLIEYGYAASTIARRLSVINTVYSLLKKEGLLDANPFINVRRPRVLCLQFSIRKRMVRLLVLTAEKELDLRVMQVKSMCPQR